MQTALVVEQSTLSMDIDVIFLNYTESTVIGFTNGPIISICGLYDTMLCYDSIVLNRTNDGCNNEITPK